MKRGYDRSQKENIQNRIRNIVRSSGKKNKLKKKRNEGFAIQTPHLHARIVKPQTLSELFEIIEDKVNSNTPLIKRLQTMNEVQSVLERSYAVHRRIDNITTYSEDYVLGSTKMELSVLTPSMEFSQPESKNWFFGDTLNKDLIAIFGSYMEAGIREAFKSTMSLRKKIREKRRVKSSLSSLVRRDFKRVDISDLINEIKVRRVTDMVPEKVALVPYGLAMQYGGYTWLDDIGTTVIGVRSLLYDKISATNPKKPNAVTAAHEVIHAKVQGWGRNFHDEHLTHLIDLMAKNKRTFFFEFLVHPYTEEVEILDVIDHYLDEGIKPLYESIRGIAWTQNLKESFWNKELLGKAKLIEEKLEQVRLPTINLMQDAEAKYYSLDKYGLDAWIMLTGMECFPLWLTAVKKYPESAVGTKEERRIFKRDYGKVLDDLITTVKGTYFEEVKEYLLEHSFIGPSHNIREVFQDALNMNYDFSLSQKKLAWDMFLRTFVKDGKITYDQINPKDVSSSIYASADLILDILSTTHLSSEKAEVLLDRLQLYDYLGMKLNLAEDLAMHRAELLTDKGELKKANKVTEYSSRILLPGTELLGHYGQQVLVHKDVSYTLDEMFKQNLKTLRKKSLHLTIPVFKEKIGLRYFKVMQYFDDDNCAFVSIYRGYKKKRSVRYDAKPSAIMFSSDDSDRLNVMLYASINDKTIPGYGMFDNLVVMDEGFLTVSLDELLNPESKTWYQMGEKAYSKLDWLRES